MKELADRWGRRRTFLLLGATPCVLALLSRLSLAFPLSHVGSWGRVHTHLLMLLAALALGFSLVTVPLLAIGLALNGRWRRALVGVALYLSALCLSFKAMTCLW